jgi:hypothetical protein
MHTWYQMYRPKISDSYYGRKLSVCTWGSRKIAPPILGLSTGLGCMVNFMPLLLYSWGEIPGLTGPQSQNECFGEAAIERRLLSCPVLNLVTTLTQLFPLFILWHNKKTTTQYVCYWKYTNIWKYQQNNTLIYSYWWSEHTSAALPVVTDWWLDSHWN